MFDLTVEHEWHTFVAEGVFVHNEQRLGCTYSDAGGYIDFTGPTAGSQPCPCVNANDGRWKCEVPLGRAICSRCFPDGGP